VPLTKRLQTRVTPHEHEVYMNLCRQAGHNPGKVLRWIVQEFNSDYSDQIAELGFVKFDERNFVPWADDYELRYDPKTERILYVGTSPAKGDYLMQVHLPEELEDYAEKIVKALDEYYRDTGLERRKKLKLPKKKTKKK